MTRIRLEQDQLEIKRHSYRQDATCVTPERDRLLADKERLQQELQARLPVWQRTMTKMRGRQVSIEPEPSCKGCHVHLSSFSCLLLLPAPPSLPRLHSQRLRGRRSEVAREPGRLSRRTMLADLVKCALGILITC